MIGSADIDATVRAFANTLARTWSDIQAVSRRVSTGSYIQDWMQANWEMLVEATLPPGEAFLEVYGEGADCNDRSSRIFRPEAQATHTVICTAPTGEGVVEDLLSGEQFTLGAEGLPLEEFVTMDGNWFAREPPFDCVLLHDDGRERVVSTEAVRFALGPASRS